MNNNINSALKNVFDVIYLTGCALNQQTPSDDAILNMNLSDVYECAKRHSVSSVTCFGLELWLNGVDGSRIDADLLSKWRNDKNNAIRNSILFDVQRERIFDFMESQKIRHMALKGTVLKALYPHTAMRQMADNDILYDQSYQDVLKQYMLSEGFSFDKDSNSVHDICKKEPIYNFEMHRSLFDDESKTEWSAYYENVFDRLEKEDGKGYRYRFGDEDFYVYMMLHSAKHYRSRGHGIRIFADVYVYLKKKPNLDFDYITKELDRLLGDNYEPTVRSLSLKLFEENCNWQSLTEEERSLLYTCTGAGTYGSTKLRVKNALKKRSNGNEVTPKVRLKYFLHRLFPLEYTLRTHPFLAKHKILVPFFCVWRILKAVFTKPRRVLKEIKLIWK